MNIYTLRKWLGKKPPKSHFYFMTDRNVPPSSEIFWALLLGALSWLNGAVVVHLNTCRDNVFLELPLRLLEEDIYQYLDHFMKVSKPHGSWEQWLECEESSDPWPLAAKPQAHLQWLWTGLSRENVCPLSRPGLGMPSNGSVLGCHFIITAPGLTRFDSKVLKSYSITINFEI